MKRYQATILSICLIQASACLYAQNNYNIPGYRDGRLLNSHSRVIFQARTIFGLEAKFKNLGEITYPSDLDADGDGEIVEFVFNDGYINLSEDESTFSSDFAFDMENANVGSDGIVESFTLNRYRTSPSNEVFSESPSTTAAGWEVAYQYEWGTRQDRLRYGFIAGFAVNDLNFTTNQVVNGSFYVQTAQVNLNGPEITYVDGDVYRGASDGPSIDLASDVNFNSETEELVVQDIWGQGAVVVPSEVASWVDHDGILANLRMGPLLSYQIINRLHLQASAGLNFSYYNSNVSVRETLFDLIGASDYTVFKNHDSVDWLVGYYLEAAAYYYLNDRTAAYGSVQMFSMNSPSSDSVEGVDYEVNLKSSFVFSLGVKLAL